MTEFKPCPFCGRKDVDPKGWMSTDDSGPACNNCGATAETVEAWNTRHSPWQPMETAPRDGTEIIGLVNGDEVCIRWSESRRCMLAGIGGGNGYFGEGWEETVNNLISDEPTHWMPLHDLPEEAK